MKPYAGMDPRQMKGKKAINWGPTPKSYDKVKFGKDLKKAFKSKKKKK